MIIFRLEQQSSSNSHSSKLYLITIDVLDIRSCEIPACLILRWWLFTSNFITDANGGFLLVYRAGLMSHWVSMQPPILGNSKIDLGLNVQLYIAFDSIYSYNQHHCANQSASDSRSVLEQM